MGAVADQLALCEGVSSFRITPPPIFQLQGVDAISMSKMRRVYQHHEMCQMLVTS